MLPPWMVFDMPFNAPAGDQPPPSPLALSLVFAPAGGSVPGGVTITRASSKVTNLGTSDATVGSNIGSIEAAGLVVEAAHTNGLTQSLNMTAGFWQTRGGTALTVALSPRAGPDGGNAYRLTNLGTIGVDDIFQIVSSGYTASGIVTAGFWVNRVSTSGTLGAYEATGSNGHWQINLSLLPNAWTYITVNHPAVTVLTPWMANSSGAAAVLFSADAGGPLTIDFGGVQLQDGAVPMSYVPTTTIPITCAADVPSAGGGLLPKSGGSVSVVFTAPYGRPSAAGQLVDSSTGGSDGVSLKLGTDGKFVLAVGGSTLATSSAQTLTPGTAYTVVATWSGAASSITLNGTSIATGSAASTTTHGTLYIGCNHSSGAQLDGSIASVVFTR